MKLLIDTGCHTSMLRPSIVEKYYPNLIFRDPSQLKTSLGEKEIQFKAIIPAFEEFQSDYEIEFILFQFHEFFDGILGLKELKNLDLTINFTNQILYNDFVQIPFYYRQPYETSFTFEISPRESLVRDYPVNISDGEIIIPRCYINNLFIPETLTYASNYRACFEIYNNTDRTICVTINEPFSAYSINTNYFELFNIESALPNDLTEMTNKTYFINDLNNNIRTNHMNAEEQRAILKLCNEFSDIFHNENSQLTFTNQIKHDIKTTDELPTHTKSYRFPHCHKEEVNRQIDKMLDDGIIRPSSSPWSSPIWIVPKKADASGKKKWRIVVDYRKLNEKTVDDRYPIPNIDDILDKLGKCNYFTTLDLASGFHQIEMEEKSIEKTAFNVEHGHFEYVRMPFGLKNAPATFQRVMDHILRGLQNKICLVYMDDIIIFSTSLQEHISNLKQVFQKLRESKLKIQLDKSEFLK